MGRGKKCYLCDRERSSEVTFHRLPKDLKVRHAWLAFCNLDETTDDVSNLEICCGHFQPHDYLEPRAKEFGNRLILKRHSVPSILTPIQPPLSQPLPSTHGFYISGTQLQIEIETRPHSSNFVVESTKASGISPETSGESKRKGHQTLKKRILPEPRYVSEVHSLHLSTLRRAKRNFELLRMKILQQSRKIKILKQKYRRQAKQITSLKDLIKLFKEK